MLLMLGANPNRNNNQITYGFPIIKAFRIEPDNQCVVCGGGKDIRSKMSWNGNMFKNIRQCSQMVRLLLMQSSIRLIQGSIPCPHILKMIWEKKFMASQNKKNKARNSYLYNGGDKSDMKMKRIMYFTKRQRNNMKKSCKIEI